MVSDMTDVTANQRFALGISHMTKWGTAIFMAATPILFAIMIYQNGFNSVPVYINRQLAGYVNNVVASLIFCWLWLTINYVIFRVASHRIQKARAHGHAA
jgi:hypothetical protein